MRRLVGLAGIVACAVLASWGLTEAAPFIWNPLGNDSRSAGVVRVVDTENPNLCDPDDPLVKKYQRNFVRLIDNDKEQITGTGLLLSDCSRIITVGHTLWSDNGKERVTNLGYETSTNGDVWLRNNVPRNATVSEGVWKATGLFKDEATTIVGPPLRGCAVVKTVSGLKLNNLRKLADRGGTVLLLKYIERSERLCVQRCNILETNEDTRDLYTGTIEHDCSTRGGNSGSPIFVKPPDGDDVLVGLHVGYNRNKVQHNIFIPIKTEDLAPEQRR